MKIVSKEEFDAHERATLRGAVEGLAAGLAISLPGSYFLHRRWAYYRSLPISLKALGVVIAVAPMYAIQAERRGIEFDRSQWHDSGKATLEAEEVMEEQSWQSLSMREKVGKWAFQNQYGIIAGSWALSMAVASVIIMKDRHQTTAQKVVQARMWAQGLTIGVLISAGILTHGQREEAVRKHGQQDHSWALVLAEQEKQKKQTMAGSL